GAPSPQPHGNPSIRQEPERFMRIYRAQSLVVGALAESALQPSSTPRSVRQLLHVPRPARAPKNDKGCAEPDAPAGRGVRHAYVPGPGGHYARLWVAYEGARF